MRGAFPFWVPEAEANLVRFAQRMDTRELQVRGGIGCEEERFRLRGDEVTKGGRFSPIPCQEPM